MRQLYCNDSMFDSLGAFYSVISSTQGGWTWLSSEGRYMGAAAWGDMNRASNPYYARLKEVLRFRRATARSGSIARWRTGTAIPSIIPTSAALIEILGEPLKPDQLWNPDAVLRVEDIHHRPDTQDRLDKAAATQLVFEDAMIHVVDHLLRATGASRLVLTGGVALNAVGNMRLLEHFDEAWFARARNSARRACICGCRRRRAIPASPSARPGCLRISPAPARRADDARLLLRPAAVAARTSRRRSRPTISPRQRIGDISTAEGRDAIADLMAFMVAQNGVIALYQGAAETGPRALGHRSILANPCDPGRARTAQRKRQIPRGDPAAGADGDAGGGAGIFRAARRRLRRRLQRLQLHGADRAIEAARARQNSGGDPCRRHRADPDRARRKTIPSPTPI